MLVADGVNGPVLAGIVGWLVDVCHPERIYLFGSAARGEANVDSEYDLMLIVPDEPPPALRDTGRAHQALWGVGTSEDILVRRRGRFEEQRHLRASLPPRILREGNLLFAA